MTLPAMPHSLERTVLIHARRETVFRYFTDSARFAAWWGEGSTIDATVGGKVLIRHPGAVESTGEVLEIDPPKRIAFTLGFTSGKPMPPGSSKVTVTLDEEPRGTRLALRHEFADTAARDQHVQGWRYQLAVFANVVADALAANAEQTADAWFAAWSEPNAAKRSALLRGAVSNDVRFRDRFSLVEGLTDLEPHLAAVHMFMPGSRLERSGPVRHCQGTLLADWTAKKADGTDMGNGTNIFTLDADGKVADVVGVWG